MESRLNELIWVNDVAMSCDYIGNFDIHAIDAALWTLGKRPIAATGASDICRPDAHGDARDVCALIYEYADGLLHQHAGQALSNNGTNELSMAIHGTQANYDLSGFPPQARVILTALKTYGMILADNGGDWFLSGAPNPRWDDEELATMKSVKVRDFEVVRMGEVVTS